MLTFRLTALVICSTWLAALAQPNNQDCAGAIPICQNVYTQANSYSGSGNIPGEISSGLSCLGAGELNAVWYTFTVQQPGNVCFTITPNDPFDDYDWAVYNLTSANCTDIATNASLEVRCNFSGNIGCNGLTGPNGATTGPCAGQNESCFPVLLNQTYVVNVSNFSSTQSGYTIDFSASTAVIFDNVPPTVSNIVGLPLPCNATSTLTMNFSENVLCNTVQPTDFQVVGPSGTIHTVTSATGAACALGGAQEKKYTLTFTPAITSGGVHQLQLIGPVTDLCGNVAPNGMLPFTIGIAVANAGPDMIICANATDTIGLPQPTAGYTYQWSPTTGAVGPTNEPALAVGAMGNSTPTTVTYTLTATDAVGCVGTDQVTVNFSALFPAAFAGSDLHVCADDSTQIGPTAQPGYTYQWGPVAGTIGSTTLSKLKVGQLGNATPLVTDYILSVLDVNNCPGTDTVQVQFVPFPPVGFSLPDSLCTGEAGIMLADTTSLTGVSYAWNFSGALASSTSIAGPIQAIWAAPGIKNVTLTSTIQGCTKDSVQQVIVSAIPTAAFTLAPDVCHYDTTSLAYTGTGGVAAQLLWDFSGGTNTGTARAPIVAWTEVDTQSVTLVVTENGCTSLPFPKSIIVHALPVADFTFQNACEDSLLRFSSTATVPSPEVILLNHWDFGGTTVPDTAITAITAHSYPVTGTYMVTHTVTTTQGCADDTVQSVLVYPTPVANFRWEDNCENLHTKFIDLSTVTGMGAVVDGWQWSFGNNRFDTQQHPTQQYLGSGDDSTYVVQLAIKTATNCLDTVYRAVVINPAPRVAFDKTDVCLNDPTVFTDLSQIMQTDRHGNDSLGRDFLANWHWEFGDSLNATSAATHPQYVYPYYGDFTARLTVTSDSGCVSSFERELTVFPPPPDPIVADDTVCFHDQALLTVEAPADIVVRWFEDMLFPTPFYSGYDYLTPPVVYPMTYYVQTVTEHECKSGRMPIVSSLWPDAGVALMASTNVVEMPNAAVQFAATATKPLALYTWDFGGDSTSTEADPTHTFTMPGFFTVTATISDEDGCPYVQETIIEVKRLVYFTVPSAFTPNGDPSNSELFVTSTNITQMHFQLFDRWGHSVYETQEIGFRWNGLDTGGKPVQEGVYLYVIEATSFDGYPLSQKGSIVLFR